MSTPYRTPALVPPASTEPCQLCALEIPCADCPPRAPQPDLRTAALALMWALRARLGPGA